MAGSATIEGGPELAQALRDLGKTAGKNTMRRVGVKRLRPMRDAAIANARERSGDLKQHISVGTRLARSQRQARGVHVGGGEFRTAAKDRVQVYMGPDQRPQAITEEFGTFDQAANPYMRPAFDAHAAAVIPGIGDDLWAEIARTAERAARKAARIAAGGGRKKR